VLAATFKITNKDSSGTCFLLEPPPASRWSNGIVIVVTAAHALEQAPAGTECLIIMRERHADGSFARREMPLTIRSGGNPLWVKHPDEDVAALELTLPMGVPCQPRRLDQVAQGCIKPASLVRHSPVGSDFSGHSLSNGISSVDA
jgi:hypothetical protein